MAKKYIKASELELKEKLVLIGLSNKESEVYIALLKIQFWHFPQVLQIYFLQHSPFRESPTNHFKRNVKYFLSLCFPQVYVGRQSAEQAVEKSNV